ncbi:class I SAM-dependent methyltransferase [Streptomyces sp. 8K308]|uniref:class I SAM-dependent methyltransferase n=1 Tax=Streptomyces sp. 8K308 TaxID=2530388 RepID=UPI00104796DC|nr:class I SAM-dependent methyltransferase [Streptomyces sp. 8K308]TDC06871.1 class I SAM-dependent methyltransferase [Streptomyces sp. 8K308]
MTIHPGFGSREFAVSFNSIAAEYAAARPDYPAALYDAIEELADRPLAGARVLDVGAGTGIGTRPMLRRGATVTAAEPGPGMAGQLRAHLPAVRLVRADGNALPFSADAFDVVTYAQAFHWTDPTRAVPEARRVLRPGGALALWWNVPDHTAPWQRDQERRLRARLPGYHRGDISADAPRIIGDLDPALATAYREVGWSRVLPLAAHLANLATHSFFAVLGPEAAQPVLDAERAVLEREFPEGEVRESYTVRLTVARVRG